MKLREMTEHECVAVLSANRLGRLACAKDNRPYVVPFHYAYADDHLYGFSMLGQKIEWMRANPFVCVQVDQFAPQREWRSVVAYGQYEELPDAPQWRSERYKAWSLLQKKQANWWEPGALKPASLPAASPPSYLYFRILIDSLTGRQALHGEIPLSA